MPSSMARPRFSYEYNENNTKLLSTLFIISSILAVLANSFVLYLVFKMKKHWKALSHQLIFSVACADIILSLTTITMVTMRFRISYPEVFESPVFCPVFGIVVNSFTGISLFLVTILALERFLLICLRRHFSPLIALILISGICICFFVISLGTSMTKAFAPDPTYTYCWPNGSSWSTAMNWLLTIIFLSTLLVLTFCYFAIFVVCYGWNLHTSPNSLTIKSESQSVPRRGAFRAMLFIICYFLCFLPKFISTLWQVLDTKNSHPFVMFIISPFCITLSTAINPLMVVLLHSRFKSTALQIYHSKLGTQSNNMDQTLEINSLS